MKMHVFSDFNSTIGGPTVQSTSRPRNIKDLMGPVVYKESVQLFFYKTPPLI